jgi:rhamnosyltransferase
MASGNIVVAHDNVFNREVCGEDGLYWRTFVDLGARLLEAESMNQPNREALGTRMRARVSERYDWEKVVDRYVAFLREEIERSVRAGASA